MASTERKLDEAKYFFTLLNIDDPYFDYILSAFLNAARSIGWVMRHEYNKIDGWEKWFNEYYLSEKAKQLLKEINELRVECAKKTGIKTDFFFLQTDMYVDEKYYPEMQKIKKLEGGEYIFSVEPAQGEEPIDFDAGAIQFVGNINRSEKPYVDTREKLWTTCKDYLNLMSEIVMNCLTKFSHS